MSIFKKLTGSKKSVEDELPEMPTTEELTRAIRAELESERELESSIEDLEAGQADEELDLSDTALDLDDNELEFKDILNDDEPLILSSKDEDDTIVIAAKVDSEDDNLESDDSLEALEEQAYDPADFADESLDDDDTDEALLETHYDHDHDHDDDDDAEFEIESDAELDVAPPTAINELLELAERVESEIGSGVTTAHVQDELFDLEDGIRRGPVSLSDLRLDIARISSDLDSGEALYRRAQHRVESLVEFIEKAEVAVSVLHRLEPEAKRLKASNRALKTEIDIQKQALETAERSLSDERQSHTDSRVRYETLNEKFRQAADMIRERTGDLEDALRSLETLKIEHERVKTSFDIEARENINLHQSVTDLSDKVEGLTKAKLNAEKKAESLSLDCDDLRRANHDLKTEVKTLHFQVSETMREGDRMRIEFAEIQNKLLEYKNSHAAQLQRRNEKIGHLEQLIGELERKLRFKEEMVENAVADVTELRREATSQQLERERLEKVIQRQTHKLDVAEHDLLKSKKEMSALGLKYQTVAENLADYQRARAAVRAERTERPDIYPTMNASVDDALEPKRSDSIADRFDPYLDPSFGIR